MKHAWTFVLAVLLALTAAGCDVFSTDGDSDGDDSDGGGDRASVVAVTQRAVA